MDEHAEWDGRYAESERIWSGEPNGALVAEIAGMPPGRVLDVGCGEGADAIWLAGQGWTVTALDASSVAMARAESHAADAGVEVTFVQSGLLDAGLEPGSFDLVSALYPALRHTPEHDTEGILLNLVNPGGTLLFVHHLMDHHQHEGHDHGDHDHADNDRFDPADYVGVQDMRDRLESGWVIDVHEERDRHISGGRGAGHSRDVVLRARRGAQPDHELEVLEVDQDVPPRPEETIADA